VRVLGIDPGSRKTGYGVIERRGNLDTALAWGQITASPRVLGSLAVNPHDSWLQPPIEGIVLELKFTDRFPKWMGELVKSFNLWRDCMAKYVYCAESDNRNYLSMR